MDFDASSLSLISLLLLATYTTYLCSVPPNPSPNNPSQPDSLSIFVTPKNLFIRRLINVLFSIYHILLTLTYPSPSPLICRFPSHLSPSIFTWSPRTIIYLFLALGGAFIRLNAFRTLGADFKFRLDKPKKLITSGMYSYIRHPSYIGQGLIILANMTLMNNQRGPIACWLPMWVVNASWFWGTVGIAMCGLMMRLARKRVSEEEALLKGVFGKEWEQWHGKTARFIPGLI